MTADERPSREVAETLRGLGRTVVTYGEAADADIRLVDLELTPELTAATLVSDGDTGCLALAVPGRYNLHNAAAA